VPDVRAQVRHNFDFCRIFVFLEGTCTLYQFCAQGTQALPLDT
jgi:hypothetical protein